MNKQRMIAIAAAVVIGVGVLYAFGGGYVQLGVPVQKDLDAAVAQEDEGLVATSEQGQSEQLDELRQQIEELNAELQKAKEVTSNTASVTEDPVVSSVSVAFSTPNNAVPKIAFTKATDLTLNVGDTNNRTATTTPAGIPVTYISSDPTVATVAADGNVTCLAAGKTVITAQSGELSTSYNLTVNAALPVAQKTDAVKSSNTGSPLANYSVTVNDKSTPAVRSGGTDWPITTYYFIAADGTKLGSVTGKAYTDIMEKYRVKSSTSSEWLAPGSGGDWVMWFADVFNEYRGVSSGNSGNTGASQSNSSTGNSAAQNADTNAYAEDVIRLINKERESKGLHALDIDSSLMTHSEVRAQELSIQYSHARPNGTKETSECIVMRRNSPSAAVQAWLDSPPHRDAILNESGKFRYNYIGAGCYEDESGILYWVITFAV